MAEMSKKRCVIVAAGSIDDTSAIKAYADSADFVIAADAGYVYCRDAGIEPDLFVGDYDSSKKPKTQNELIALNPIKDATDTETALTEAEKRKYKEMGNKKRFPQEALFMIFRVFRLLRFPSVFRA